MSLSMQDSITPDNLTAGADAYGCYVDGDFDNVAAVEARFPGAHVLTIAVFAADDAHCLDREPLDATAAEAPSWIKRQQARGVVRPCIYASASNIPEVLDDLGAAGIPRSTVRLWSAHYGAGKHICGPATCAFPGVPACDGTQWTDAGAGANGSKIDLSILNDDFFGDENVALSAADIAAVAKAVWTVDGVVAGPDDNPANPFWEPNRSLTDTGVLLREIQTSIDSLSTTQSSAIVAGVLAGLSPSDLADAIATHLGPDVGNQVLSALQAKLAS